MTVSEQKFNDAAASLLQKQHVGVGAANDTLAPSDQRDEYDNHEDEEEKTEAERKQPIANPKKAGRLAKEVVQAMTDKKAKKKKKEAESEPVNDEASASEPSDGEAEGDSDEPKPKRQKTAKSKGKARNKRS